jgi:hypothetical protein
LRGVGEALTNATSTHHPFRLAETVDIRCSCGFVNAAVTVSAPGDTHPEGALLRWRSDWPPWCWLSPVWWDWPLPHRPTAGTASTIGATGTPPLSPLTAVSSAEPSVVTPPTLSVCEVFELNRVDLIVALMESRRAPA